MSATKAQSQKIFEKVKLKAANKVRPPLPAARCVIVALHANIRSIVGMLRLQQ